MAVLVTGAAGFIGHALTARLLARGDEVVGIDNLNDYYPVQLKNDRLADLGKRNAKGFTFHQTDFADSAALAAALKPHAISRVVHLGAQAGVRYSLTNPDAYVRSNLIGHVNMLEWCRHATVQHLVYASSSSVYGANTKLPFSVEDRTDNPVSLYAATKRADELMSETYAHLYRLPQTGLRFFTVYGPWGRPDMTPWLFTEAILAGKPIRVFNNGEISRDFTFIDDIVDGVMRALDHAPHDDGAHKPGGSKGPHRIYNIGNNRSEPLLKMIGEIERATGKMAIKQFEPMAPGDVKETYADIEAITRDLGYKPTTPIEVGIPKFVAWYRRYKGV
jgi:UDP-glucuronate 4-epimerase